MKRYLDLLIVVLLLCGSLFYVYGESEPETIAGLIKRPSNRDYGYDWPYYLYVPERLAGPGGGVPLLVVPNNTGWMYDDFSIHDQAALKEMERIGQPFGDLLGIPVLIPSSRAPRTP